MEPRFDMFENEVTSKFFKRLIAASVRSRKDLPKATQELVKIRASQINGCGMCLDMHTKDAAAAGETAVPLALVAAWRSGGVHRGRASGAGAGGGGNPPGGRAHGSNGRDVGPGRKHYDDEQLGALVCLVAEINTWNRLNVIARNPAGEYQPGMFG